MSIFCVAGRGVACTTCRLLGLVLLLLIVADAYAANVRWSGGGGNPNFHTAGNWTGGVVPAVLDVAQFGNSNNFIQFEYTVSFNNNATNQALHIEDDLVTFELNDRTYFVTTASGIVIGAGSRRGQLTVNNGTINSSTNIDVGATANRAGTLIVGFDGLISGAPSINIGKLATGTLTVHSGGDISSTGSTTIGAGDGTTGNATVNGIGSTLVTGTLNVGSTGNGTINVILGGLLQNSGAASVGAGTGFTGAGTGIVNVFGAGSTWNSLGLLEVGDASTGEVNITSGGRFNGVNTVLGNAASSGEVNVDGPSSSWDNSGDFTIGGLGSGTLNITNQGVVENANAFIGNSAVGPIRGSGEVNVSGTGSLWSAHGVVVGNAGTGTLNITSGGTAEFGLDAHVGQLSSGTGTVTVNGIGSLWHTSSTDVFVGTSGDGTLNITDGGLVQSVEGTIGSQPDSTGHVTVDGAGSRWEYSGAITLAESNPATNVPPGDLTVGELGNGTLEITDGGRVLGTDNCCFVLGLIGAEAGSTGHVLVSGVGSLWDIAPDPASAGSLRVGEAGNGTLEITAGGEVRADGVSIGVESSGMGAVTVDGEGSLIDVSSSLLVGLNGQATLEISGGGNVQNGAGFIRGPAAAPAAVTVDGPGSHWRNSGALNIGFIAPEIPAGAGTLAITAGGRVTSKDTFLAPVADSSATVTVGSTVAAGSTWEIDGKLSIGGDHTTGNNGGVGTLRIQPGGTVNVAGGTHLWMGDALHLEGGTLSTAEIHFNSGGTFAWTSGTLNVGIFPKDLIIPNGGTLAPGTLAVSTIIGDDLAQAAGGTLEIEIGGNVPGAGHDILFVSGFAAFAGNLQLDLINGFVPSAASRFTILDTADGIFGTFANVASGQRLATSNGLGSFVVTYGPGSAFNPNLIVLSAFQAIQIPGDYNQNGTVDAADYVVWRNSVGAATLNNRDPNAVGPVGQADYNFWRAHFGNTVGSSSADANVPVPEQATWLLSMLVGSAGTFCRKRRKS